MTKDLVNLITIFLCAGPHLCGPLSELLGQNHRSSTRQRYISSVQRSSSRSFEMSSVGLMTAVVTGASGFVASEVVKQLLEKARPICSIRQSSSAKCFSKSRCTCAYLPRAVPILRHRKLRCKAMRDMKDFTRLVCSYLELIKHLPIFDFESRATTYELLCVPSLAKTRWLILRPSRKLCLVI